MIFRAHCSNAAKLFAALRRSNRQGIETLTPVGVLNLCGFGSATGRRMAARESDLIMAEDKLDTIALLKEIAESPKRDNSAYHRAIAEARQAFEDAEATLGGSVQVRTKTKLKRNGEYTVKWTFRRLP